MKKIFFILLLGAIGWSVTGGTGCKQAYDPPAIANPGIYLVVDGFINNGPDSTYFTLTHTYALSDTAQTTPELHAQVTVQGNDNSTYPLTETGNGNYGAPISGLNSNVSYRLYIKTTAGKEYASDYVSLKVSPPIDSVSWTLNNSGNVQLYVNTHDPQNNTHYYRWDYQETWEFESTFYASLQYVHDSVQTYSPNTIYQCWKSDHSTSIILESSAQLAQDVISLNPLVNMPATSQQLSVEYSILVRQYALSQDAFTWWQTMQKNTEQIGSIFGVQPSTNTGNIHSLTDSNEVVIGYVSGGTIRTQRIFITHQQILPWTYTTQCALTSIPPDSVSYYYQYGFLLVDETMNPALRYDVSFASCVDCTLTGSNQKPSFWP